MNRTSIKWITRLLLVSVLAFLLWWVIRNAPLAEIWVTIRGLQLWEIVVLLGSKYPALYSGHPALVDHCPG